MKSDGLLLGGNCAPFGERGDKADFKRRRHGVIIGIFGRRSALFFTFEETISKSI